MDGVEIIVPSQGETVLNDASRLSETPIHKHLVLERDPGERLIAALRVELREARDAGRPVNVGAARHSMGGQAIPRDGHALTFRNSWVEPGDRIYRVHAGARWKDVIAALTPVGMSPKVMQAYNDFGVGATFSVNGHGWPTAFGPMGTTVRAIKILMADGDFLTASPTENPEIFAAAMGGYGLIGVVTELEVEAVPNQLLEPTSEVLPARDFAPAFVREARSKPMAYGRLNVDREEFFEEALLTSYRSMDGEISEATIPDYRAYLIRKLFRAQVGNEWVKRRRWGIETRIGPLIEGPSSRSSLLNETVDTLLAQATTARTDIIHEYFVAPDQFNAFLAACKRIIPGSYQELLNVTLRWVEQDPVSLLSYAPTGPRIAAVLSFSQEMSERAENDMATMTRKLIDEVHGLGGSYYLPYRPHATVAQFLEGYQRAPEFVNLKRRFDPSILFRNAFWDNYLAPR